MMRMKVQVKYILNVANETLKNEDCVEVMT